MKMKSDRGQVKDKTKEECLNSGGLKQLVRPVEERRERGVNREETRNGQH